MEFQGIVKINWSAYREKAKRSDQWRSWSNGAEVFISVNRVNSSWSVRDAFFENKAKIPCLIINRRADDFPPEESSTPTNLIVRDRRPVESVTFFGWDGRDYSIRTPGPRFPRSSSKFISWVLSAGGTPYIDNGRDNHLLAIWYKKENNSFKKWSEQTGGEIEFYAGNIKKRYVNGKGWSEAGQWEAGSYLVKIFEYGKLVTVGTFEILDDNPSKSQADLQQQPILNRRPVTIRVYNINDSAIVYVNGTEVLTVPFFLIHST